MLQSLRKLFGTVVFVLILVSSSEGQTSACLLCERLDLFSKIKQRAADRFWPGFNARAFSPPIVYFDDSISWLALSKKFLYKDVAYEVLKCSSGRKLFKMNGRLDKIPFHMENKMTFNDKAAPNYYKPIMFCSSAEVTRNTVPDVTNTEEWLQLVMHEYFHAYQFSHRDYIAYLADSIKLPVDSLHQYYRQQQWFSDYLGKENTSLLKAISAKSPDSAKHYCDDFFKNRKARRARFKTDMGFDISALEKFWEKTEGTARYLEYNLAYVFAESTFGQAKMACDTMFNGFTNYHQNDMENRPWFYIKTQIMVAYYYVIGFNLCRVMDKLQIEYKKDLFDKPSEGLEDYLNFNKDEVK